MKSVVVLLILLFIGFNLLLSCDEFQRNQSHIDIPTKSIKKGKVLAEKYCQSCHLLPDPSLLDSKTWEEGVLPVMGPMLGIFNHLYHRYPSAKRDPDLDSNYYPKEPLMSSEDWQDIINYYIATSPEALLIPADTIQYAESLPGFRKVNSNFGTKSATSSYVQIDTAQRKLWLADLFEKKLFRFDQNLHLVDSINTNASVVDIGFFKDSLLLCDIGEINPNNKKLGSAGYIPLNNKQYDSSRRFLQGLARPVQIVPADFNGDHQSDYLVCEFGFLQGGLSLFLADGKNGFNHKYLRVGPGAEKAYVRDYNRDGLPDIWVLFAQGDESIYLYINKGNGNFEENRIVRFPSVYGSTFFELQDFNGDGFEDILYTSGDNADYSQVLKPYHGVYIYLNDGKSNFRQSYFFHMNGCFKALARDYDKDGDLDIAAISFFADYSKKIDESFIYLKNEGGLHFSAHSIPDSREGRWITMDAGDLNGDGKIDLVLGNFSYGPTMMKSPVDWSKSQSFLFLQNTSQ